MYYLAFSNLFGGGERERERGEYKEVEKKKESLRCIYSCRCGVQLWVIDVAKEEEEKKRVVALSRSAAAAIRLLSLSFRGSGYFTFKKFTPRVVCVCAFPHFPDDDDRKKKKSSSDEGVTDNSVLVSHYTPPARSLLSLFYFFSPLF